VHRRHIRIRAQVAGWLLPICAMLVAIYAASLAAEAADTIDYNRDIRPILSDNCFACHGNDAKHRKAKLRLDQRDSAVKDRDGFFAIAPGKPDQSETIARITATDPDDIMPPIKSGKKLTPAQITLIRQWIQQGAPYEKHWSFVKPRQAKLPAVKQKSWPRNSIDHYTLARMEAKGFKPSAEADRYTLIRRVYLDLIGLPPTPQQVDAFVNDKSPGAYQKVVDDLLASARYGERWAQLWLDLARYADTMGYEKDRPRNIWPWRDWVIDAFNRDMPFDQFTIEQLAGDLLPDATIDQNLATAFHRNTLTNEEGGTDNEEFRVAAVKDRVDTTVQVWMGLTMGCAKCHSHKYDPITQSEYYSFYAFFNQTADADRGDDFPTMLTPTIAQRQKLVQLQSQKDATRKKLNYADAKFIAARRQWEKTLAQSETWSALKPQKVASKQGATLSIKSDSSVLASGKSPARDTYTVDATAKQARITAIRIEALTDPSLGRKGPGRNPRDPNFVISEFVVTATDSAGKAAPVALENARADFSQKGWHVGRAIDKNPKTGWAVSPRFSQPHAAIFDLAKPLDASAGVKLSISISQQYGQQLVMGRFRISVSSADPKTLAPNSGGGLSGLVAVPESKRSPQQKQQINHTFAKQWPATANAAKQVEQITRQIDALKKQGPKTPVMQQLASNKQRVTRIHVRGNFLSKGDTVKASVPAAFGAIPSGAPGNRLGVARWLVHPDNPLTARVQVNRFWARLFGRGLVLTEEDFGSQGTLPTHPQLLDYLAVEFVKRNWSIKSLLRLIVTSATYRQSSRVTDTARRADPDNILLSRAPRFRLEAETVRDQALAVAGLLSSKMYGPSVMPPQPAGIWKITYSGADWKNATGEDRYRRGLYTYWRRTSPYPSMLTFDAGTRDICVIRRVRTNTPLQALVTLNDPVHVEAAGGLASRMTGAGKDRSSRAAHGFRLATMRPPSDAETKALVNLHQDTVRHFKDKPAEARQLIQSAGTTVPKGESAETFAAWITVANVLLNLDEVMMRN